MKRILFCFIAALFFAAACNQDLPETVTNETLEPEAGSQVTVIHARFEDPATKSRIQMNASGTAAKVLWTREDAIMVIGAISETSYYWSSFSTADDGVSEADFSCNSWNLSSDVTHFVGFYPSAQFKGNGSGFSFYIPSVQTAVKNGIEEGLNRAYAYTTSLEEGLQFRNLPALVKFRLSGSVVSQLASVKFVSNTTIAGDIVVGDLNAAEPTFCFDITYGERQESPTSVVELKGSFEAGVDYYIAMIPGTTDGFSMLFIDNAGNYIIKESSKTLTLNRSHIVDFGTVDVGDSFGDSAVTQYMAGTVSNPADIVVLPDGFTDMQRESFETMAKDGIDFLFSTEPYHTYKDYFNVYFIWKASAEAGASISDGNGTIQTLRNTAFGSFWGEGENNYGDMAADVEAVYAFVSAHCPEIIRGQRTIDEVPVLMLINDNRYGGRAHSTSSGRTYCQVPYTDAGGELHWSYPNYVPTSDDPTNGYVYRQISNEDLASIGISYSGTTPSSVFSNTGDWRNTLIHEFGGHSFGRLKDEYWYGGETISVSPQGDIDTHSWPVPFGLNISGYYDTVPWQSLLDAQTDLVARDSRYSRIGRFQGGDVELLNRWRSEKISCMIDNRPYFSTWQRYLIVKRILELAGESSTLTLDTFLAKDDPTDPLRDGASLSSVTTKSVGPVRIMPPLAPPELVDNTARR